MAECSASELGSKPGVNMVSPGLSSRRRVVRRQFNATVTEWLRKVPTAA